MKNSFSLFETVLVVFIISLFYIFINVNFSKLSEKEKEEVNLKTLKKYLSKQTFEENISLKCIEEASRCLVLIDGAIERELKDIFKEQPTVYSYSQQMDVVTFDSIDIDGYRNYHVDFSLTLDRELKHQDLLVEVRDKIYYFNSMFLELEEFNYFSEVVDSFESKIEEVRYAF